MTVLEVKELACIKQDRQLFEKLSFSLAAGQVLHLQGPNGAGKTSLLRIIAGLSEPQQGEVMWKGKAIRRHSIDYGQDIIYHGHKLGLDLQLSAVENLQYWLQVNGIEQSFDLFEVLAKWGLVGLEDIPLGHLSAGQQRRVSLARLGLKTATFWILDEPFTALDTRGIAQLQRVIEKHVDSGGLVLLTSHQNLSLQVPCTSFALEYAW